MVFHCSSGCTSAPKCYVICTLPVLRFTTDLAPYTRKIIYGRNYSQKDPTDKCYDCTSVTNWTIENLHVLDRFIFK